MLRRIPWVASLLVACATESDDGTTAASLSSTASGATAGTDAGSDDTAPSGATGGATGGATSGEASADGDASTGGGDSSAEVTSDPSETSGSSDDGGAMGGGTIDVTLSGCEIDLGGTVVVSYNGSLGVASVYDNGASLSGSFQFDQLEVGTIELSSQHRVDTGMVVNLVDTTSTWTNLDAAALGGGVDTISGTLTVETWAPARGQSLLQFDAVTLRNVVDGGLCTVDGTIETTALYP